MKYGVGIADQTEKELIQSIQEMYAVHKEPCAKIADHIAIKLSQRRGLIRERRKKAVKNGQNQPLSKL